MNYLFDTNALSAFLEPEKLDNTLIYSLIETLEKPVFYISILSVYEYEFNIADFDSNERKEHARNLLNRILKEFKIINLSLDDAKIYGNLKKGFMKKTGINKKALKKHNIDIALASVAIANNCILVSRDKIFSNHLQEINTDLQPLEW